MRRFLQLVGIVLLAAAAWLAWSLAVPKRPSVPRVAGQTGPATVLLRPGWSSRRIATELKNQGVIRSANAFMLLHAVRLRRLKAGEYLFDQAQSAIQVYDRLARGDIYFHNVIVPEGLNMFDIAGAIEAAGLGSGDDFLRVAEDPAMVRDIDPQAHSLEGYLFPDTYRFTRAQTMQDIATEMVRRFRQKARELDLIPPPGAAPDAGHEADFVHRTVTMASIVEKETGAPEERATVAGVYYNRLQRHIALQADPSVIYASLLDGRYTGQIHRSDLEANSPYNTYKFPGLPPGPICNPGEASLKAALHPANTGYLYFVSDNNGHHRFAATLDEHEKNVLAYRRAVAGNANR
ncbi:MAG TPA: endolytic transglycosylase MltG [Terriglobales bacterium]|nr:endolytic transglycosylase MltG [Terriglobales bacterium]